MYVPQANRIEDETAVRAFVRAAGVGTLVTVGPDSRPDATLLPLIWREDRIVMHVARANDHWRRVTSGGSGLVVVQGPDAYVTPSWYPSKAEHAKVLPTWNYSAVQLRGPVTAHDDVEWVRAAVTDLTDEHEAGRDHPWAVTDAPERYVEGNLRAIVGVEMRVEHVEAKAKWSQNRKPADREGVAAAYEREGRPALADRVRTGSL